MHLTQFKKNPACGDEGATSGDEGAISGDEGATSGDEGAKGFTYHLVFSDGTEGNVSSQTLRDNCPCASCSGEQVLLHEYIPLNKHIISDAGYQLEKAEPVGNYAIKLTWKDGHDTGIYTWNHLKKLINQIKPGKENES